MATLFASGALWNTASNWGTTTGASDGTVPTASDDVKFDVNSISMAIDVNAVCLSLDSTGFTATLTQNTTRTLTIGAGGLTWAAGTFAGGDATIDLNGSFALSGGTFTSTSATLFVEINFTVSGAPTFTHNSGTVRLGEDNNVTITTLGITFNDLEFFKVSGPNSTVTLADNFTVSGNLLVDQTDASEFRILPTGTRIITLKGDFFVDAIDNDSVFGSSLLTLLVDAASGDQTFTQAGGMFGASLDINKASDSLVLATDFAFQGNFTRTAGGLNQAGFTVSLGGNGDVSITAGGLSFVNLEFKKTFGSSSTVTLIDNFTITGNLNIDNTDLSDFEILPSGTRIISLEGNYTTAGTDDTIFGNVNLTLKLTGTADQTFTRTGATFNAVLDIDKASGVAKLALDPPTEPQFR